MILVSVCWNMNFPHNETKIIFVLLMMSLKLTVLGPRQLQPRRDRDETISVRDRDETETLVFRISRDENETETITFETETRPRQYCRDSKRDTSYFHTMLQARRSTAIIAHGSIIDERTSFA